MLDCIKVTTGRERVSTNIGPEEYRLMATLDHTLHDAHQVLSRIDDIETKYSSVLEAIEDDEDLYREQQMLEYFVKKALREVRILCERLGLVQLLAAFQAECAALGDKYGGHERDDDEFESHSPHLRLAYGYMRSIQGLLDPTHLGGLDVFRTILENSAQIIAEAGLKPQNEAKVRAAIVKVLKYGFRQVEKEIKTPKEFKTYQIDLGIRSLRAAAEYKFIDSEADAKAAMDGIYADMHGYGGTQDWSYFFAVLYQTKPFITQSKTDQEMQIVRADRSWTAILVTGPGGRAKRAPKLDASAVKAKAKKAVPKAATTKDSAAGKSVASKTRSKESAASTHAKRTTQASLARKSTGK